MKKVLFLIGLTLSVVAGTLPEKCSSCHGVNGEKMAFGSKSAIIKDLPKDTFLSSVMGYKNGTFGGQMKKVMEGVVVKIDDAELKQIVEDFYK